MFDTKAKRKTIDFLKHVRVLEQNSTDRIVKGFEKTEKELINEFIVECAEFIDFNEWGVGLEILLDNINEIQFTLDRKAIDLARAAIVECGMNYDDWRFIESLVK
ncbi:MAG: hypothetical protein JSS79_10450 [Bacteroidetes bacterium]|nr:hypothetical protein [Bacteroidota bacterium]